MKDAYFIYSFANTSLYNDDMNLILIEVGLFVLNVI